MRWLLVLLLSATVLSGCASPSEKGVDEPTGAPQVDLEDALTAYAAGKPAANVARLAQFGGNAAEVDAWGDFLFVDAGQTVDIYNVSDPLSPQEVASITGLPDIQDVKVSDDGQWLFVGNDEEASMGLPGGQTTRKGGFHVVDVSDKANPVLTSFLPVGMRRGPHMVTYHMTAAGDELVFGANADVSINRFDRATGTLTELSRYQANLVTAFNRDPNVVDVMYQGWAHDMFVMEDPVENRTLMYVANWDAGLRIVDVSEPSQPREVGSWNDYGESEAGNLHTVATEWLGDRRITVGSVEVGFAVVGGTHYAMRSERSLVYVWDTTDVANVALLGMWENPDGVPADRDKVEGRESSTHNFQLEDGRLYLAHYAMGIFILDVSTPESQASPAVLGYFQEPANTVWDVVLVHGAIHSAGSAGIVTLHYSPDVLGASGIDSRA